MVVYFVNYAVETSALGAKFLAGAQGAFAVGRFSGTFIMKFVRSRWVFLAYLLAVIAFVSASTTQGNNIDICKLLGSANTYLSDTIISKPCYT